MNECFQAGIVIDPSWYDDSGATNHVTAEHENMHLKDYCSKDKLKVGNGKHFTITHIGHSILPANNSKIYCILKMFLECHRLRKAYLAFQNLQRITMCLLNFVQISAL
ncbi:hypothetical protein PanWU01x14_221160 [Parasponia andersonii]|uniref:Retrovirus-related Pol polyprotein from transposon TNT 1-94-like beta-barrel domain-containing protein n=1 Tax=Parasponia andersonii TaxID=3476 RepID=A0A2P5BPS9_PARAD|nr:hypothetical protein PanWU01x14_221160 [Parasponia andersonii]